MGIRKKLILSFLSVVYGLAILAVVSIIYGAVRDFHTANVHLFDKIIIDAQVDSLEAYYLGEDGTLYSPGADSDAGRYVIYKNRKEGIVAEDVKLFGTMPHGGFYIDEGGDLYSWNRDALPQFNLPKARKVTKIAEGVKFAAFGAGDMIYIDQFDRLCFAGEWENETYTVQSPRFLGEKVSAADISETGIVWCNEDNEIAFWGDEQFAFKHLKLQEQIQGGSGTVAQIKICDEGIVLLQGDTLWYSGDYERLINGEEGDESEPFPPEMLSRGIVNFDCTANTVVAADRSGQSFVWGKYLSNSAEQTQVPVFEYGQKVFLLPNILRVKISGNMICLIDDSGKTNVFREEDQWHFCGNSDFSEYVGIHNAPVVWVER